MQKCAKSSNERYYYLHNGYGDAVQIGDRNSQIVNAYNYVEWVNLTHEQETIHNSFKYAGEIYDEETGLYYLRARYYDPSMGRFINKDTYEGDINNPLSLNLYTYVHNNPLIYVDPTGHWNEKLGFNYIINEYKNMWSIAPTKAERDYWNNEAEKIRSQARKAGYSNSDIMLSTDKMIPMEEIMKRAHDMFPVLSAVQGFTEGLASYVENHPGEGAAISIGAGIFKFGKISKLEKGLNFTATTVQRMENIGRFVPVQTLQSAIKYGKTLADPQGAAGAMNHYTVMYKTESKVVNGVTKNYLQPNNLVVTYHAKTNTVLHFLYTRDAIPYAGLSAIPRVK